jgi:hypothetical protein
MAILPKYVHFPGIFLPFLAISCTHFSYLVLWKLAKAGPDDTLHGQLKCTEKPIPFMVVYRCQYYSSYKLYICQKVSEKGSSYFPFYSYQHNTFFLPKQDTTQCQPSQGQMELHHPTIGT